MSVQLNPSNSLGFRRPLTTLVKRSLTITNNNNQPVAFKVKTTAPKLYCVRPNSGRVEPGESVDVSVMLQALREEPPLNTKCKDKFLIQSTIITPDQENLSLHDLWARPDVNEEGKVFQQKLRVTYLPAEGERLDEEDETAVQPPLPAATTSSHYDTVRQAPTNGRLSSLDDHDALAQQDQQENRSHSPANDYVQREPSYDAEQQQVPVIVEPPPHQPSPSLAPAAPLPEHTSAEQEYHPEPIPESSVPVATQEKISERPSAPAPPAPEPIYITRENPINEELYAKYNLAQAEIDRLKAQIAELSAPPPSELRRRTRKLSDADSATVSDFQTVVEEIPVHQEGVPLQVVVIVALGVFVTTYLFF